MFVTLFNLILFYFKCCKTIKLLLCHVIVLKTLVDEPVFVFVTARYIDFFFINNLIRYKN
ncbi:hypothetical protein HanRHA438_Chr15g0690781 [Helianthus annuus]|nr:hypothetical protein HanRHA438_Chr15g0690781 [Helianthus annuus]